MSSATSSYRATEFDPFSTSVVDDPYPWYAGLHAGPRVLRQEKWDFWMLSRHGDVSAALRDPRMSSAEGVTYLRAPLPMMLTQDPPDHERLRKIVGREFAPRDIHRFRPDIERFVSEALDEMVDGRTNDLVEAVAITVPIRVMAKILGVPEADIPELRRMAHDLVEGFALAPEPTPLIDDPYWSAFDLQRATRAIAEIHAYFVDAIAKRRKSPTADLISKLMDPPSGDQLTEGELLWFCLLLLVAGIETTTNLIGNMGIAFARHPDDWQRVRSDRDLVVSAVSETLRFDPPIQGFFRTTLASYALDDVEIPQGSRVLLVFGAANHDPVHYPDPDAFRVERNPTDHLAFGGGIHRCLGAGLAELEGRVVLEQLLELTDRLEIDGEVVRTTNPTLRGAKKLELSTTGWRR